MLKPVIRLACLAAVGLMLACSPNGLPNIPTTSGVSPLPSSAPATTTPTASAAPTPIPSSSGFPACTRSTPAGNPTVGTARQGDYLGQNLPEGYEVHGNEAAVTAAIQKIYDARTDWRCFESFYGGAATVFKRKGRLN